MSAVTTSATVERGRDRRIPFSIARDTAAIGKRNLLGYLRVPQLLVFSTIQPVIFVVMFRYVFGGAIGGLKGVPYVDFLMPGIFVQTVVFGSIATAIGLATDMKSGLMERFHALPMARSAVLTGRTSADLLRYVVGWRVHTNAIGLIAAALLVLLFGFAMSWIFATVGLWLGDPESAQAAAFPVIAPLVFASSAFVPVEKMPGWLQVFANHQPVSVTVNAVRALTLGGPTATYVWPALAWIAGILIVFATLSVRLYRRTV
jgi:ABC transporter DrrB family efflux protein